MSEQDQIHRHVVGVTSGAGYQALVAEISGPSSAGIHYYTLPVLQWITFEYQHSNPEASQDIETEAIVLIEETGQGVELSTAVEGLGETAAYRIINPEMSEVPKEILQELENELLQQYARYIRKSKKTQAVKTVIPSARVN